MAQNAAELPQPDALDQTSGSKEYGSVPPPGDDQHLETFLVIPNGVWGAPDTRQPPQSGLHHNIRSVQAEKIGVKL